MEYGPSFKSRGSNSSGKFKKKSSRQKTFVPKLWRNLWHFVTPGNGRKSEASSISAPTTTMQLTACRMFGHGVNHLIAACHDSGKYKSLFFLFICQMWYSLSLCIFNAIMGCNRLNKISSGKAFIIFLLSSYPLRSQHFQHVICSFLFFVFFFRLLSLDSDFSYYFRLAFSSKMRTNYSLVFFFILGFSHFFFQPTDRPSIHFAECDVVDWFHFSLVSFRISLRPSKA